MITVFAGGEVVEMNPTEVSAIRNVASSCLGYLPPCSSPLALVDSTQNPFA